MDVPGSSLCNGASLHFDDISVEPGTRDAGEEDEAETAEEEERRNQELQNVLKDAFDDLIEDDDEDEDGTLNHTGDPSFHPEKYPTSTPFVADRERSLFDELGGQYNLPRMSDPDGGYVTHPDGDYPRHPDGDYQRHPDGDYQRHPDGDYPCHPDGDYPRHPDDYPCHPDGGYRRDSDEYEPEPVGASDAYVTLRPEETNKSLTEMVNTPRQYLDTSGTDTSAAHYRHCYTSPRNELATSGDAADEDASSGNMIEMGLKAHEADWGGDRPERLDPGKYVANKQKDYILARSSRDQLETLYEARGHEIGRLRAEAERVP
ncbi:uncharacterized protein LOC119111403 [Pollicipes pollicipes]|uniref:uncharacterized protein LOC119111403 n=1 Tax=Pollicipes pollicipes TaxID=41117 RepID=UPI001884E085|nr:uncharacterized protein LOC119111403 [Pollicipes pollicipes]